MNLLLLCLSSLVIVTTVTCVKPHYDIKKAEALFEEFIKTYGKTYSKETEKLRRLDIFKENLKRINYKNSISKAEFAVNKFTDMSKEEFQAQNAGFKFSPLLQGYTACSTVTDDDIMTEDALDLLNWREEGVVTPVKDQSYPKSCGSCWAFSTIGNIEGQYAIKNKQLKSFSEQELLDCSRSNYACYGGFMTAALVDLISLGGVVSESSYPYVGKKGECQFNKTDVEVEIKSCINYKMTDEVKFKEVLAKQGPISVAVNGDDISSYQSGILSREDCSPDVLSHAVLLVGYGTEDGTDYWLIKNSWGTTWGEEGYFKISRGENTCGIMNNYSASAVV